MHLDVRIEDNTAGGVVDQTHWKLHLQLTATCLGQLPTEQASTQHVQLGLAHGALQAKQQPIVEMCRVVQAVFVKDQRVCERTDLK